jgi:hypothetical protein
MYVIDTSVVSALHKNYYRDRFPTLWKNFDQLVLDGQITSTREAFRELEDFGGDSLSWAKAHEEIFTTPDATEGTFVVKIYSVPHFLANMEKQKLLKGGRNADPFLIARAATLGGTVLTMEQFKPGGAKIPNICTHFKIPCIDLRGFMEQEGWTF